MVFERLIQTENAFSARKSSEASAECKIAILQVFNAIISDMTNLRKNLYDHRAAGALYSVTACLLVLFSLIFSMVISGLGLTIPSEEDKPDWYLYCNYLIPQLVFAVAIVLFFIFTDAKPKEVYKGAKWQYFLIAVILQFGLFSLSGLNEAFLKFLNEVFGYTSNAQVPSMDGGKIILVILVIAVLPAIFEESIFRGLMLTPLKKFSTPVAVFISGLLFSLYHQNPAQTIYQFCCGSAFALVAIRSNSVLPTMLSHFLNNAFIIILAAFGINDFSQFGGIAFYVVAGVALVAVLVYLIFFDKKTNTKKTENVTPFWLFASLGILICGISWIGNLIEGLGIL